MFNQRVCKQKPLQIWHYGGLVCVFMFATLYKSYLHKKWNSPIAQLIMDYSLHKTLCYFCLTTHEGLGKTRWFIQLKHSVAYTLKGREASSKGSVRYVFTARIEKTGKICGWIAYPVKVSLGLLSHVLLNSFMCSYGQNKRFTENAKFFL